MYKKIAVFEDSSQSKFGGGQRISLSVMSVLSRKKRLILFDTNSSSIFFEKAIKFSSNYHQLATLGVIRFGLIGMLFNFLELISFPFFLIVNCFYIRSILKGKMDVLLYATTKKVLVYAYFMKLFYGYPFIYHAHLVENNSIIKFFYIRVLKKAIKIIAVSEAVKKNIGLKNVIKIYNPIIIEEKKIKSKKLGNKVVVATFSTLIKLKGIAYFIKSFEHLNASYNVEYWIFGEGPESEELVKYSSANIIFKGFSHDVITDLNNYVDILCFPSIVEESFGMVILEALSCGIPVISTNIGGQAELVKDGFNGFLVPIKDSIEIANKISELIKNPDCYELFSSNAILSAQSFNFDSFKADIEKAVEC
jgi:glycosyltransferase involved in cell wall biosynthesis